MESTGLELELKEQIETDPLIRIFKLIDVKKKTLENIQPYSGFILIIFIIDNAYFKFYDNNDLWKGIISVLVVISALTNTVIKFYRQKHQPYRVDIPWTWTIFFMILFGYGFYNPTLPNAWAGPVGTFIVGVVFFLDMRRIKRKHINSLKISDTNS